MGDKAALIYEIDDKMRRLIFFVPALDRSQPGCIHVYLGPREGGRAAQPAIPGHAGRSFEGDGLGVK